MTNDGDNQGGFSLSTKWTVLWGTEGNAYNNKWKLWVGEKVWVELPCMYNNIMQPIVLHGPIKGTQQQQLFILWRLAADKVSIDGFS